MTLLKCHPDKNNDSTDEDIYYYIVTANQILTNKVSRDKYDKSLLEKTLTHNELKNMYSKEVEIINYDNITDETKLSYTNEFKEKCKECDDKIYKNYMINNRKMDMNGIKYEYNKDTEITHDSVDKFKEMMENKTIKDYQDMINARKTELSDIKYEDIKDNSDFNDKFENRMMTGYFDNQIDITQDDSSLSLYDVTNNFTSLDIAFNNSYVDGGSTKNSEYISLNSAFKIMPLNVRDHKDTNMEDAIAKYKSTTFDLDNNMTFFKDVYNGDTI